MDVKDAIRGRRSIRRYSGKEVSLDDVAGILELARFSQSSGNLQNWKVVVVTDEKLRVKIAEAAAKQDWMSEAPVHLVVCNDYVQVTETYGKLGKMFSIQNCAIFAANIMNIAYAEGFGTCWVGSFPADSVKRILGIPDEGVDPEIIITLGYSAREKLEEKSRREIFDFSFFDKWGKKEGGFDKRSFFAKIKEKLFSKD